MADLNEAVERGVRNAFEKPNKYLGGRSMNQVLIGFAQGEIVPVVHGRWVPSKYKGFCECSECHDVFVYTEWLTGGKWSFCPNCGAKMDLEV